MTACRESAESQKVTLVKDGKVCAFTTGDYRFSIKPVIQHRAVIKEETGKLFECSKTCATSYMCKQLLAKLTFVAGDGCNVRYKGVEFPLSAQDMEKTGKIDELAKSALCYIENPVQFNFKKDTYYLIGNQLPGKECEVTLYHQGQGSAIRYATFEYYKLHYLDDDSTDISFVESWNQAHTRHDAQLDWCKEGKQVSFYWKGKFTEAKVVRVLPQASPTLFNEKCEVLTNEGHKISISILHRQAKPELETVSGQFSDFVHVKHW